MMGWLVLLAAAATDFGASPLVQAGHAHHWTLVHEDDELIAWLDEAWRAETVIGGVRYVQVLLRTEVNADEPIIADTIAAVDCKTLEIGMQKVRILQSVNGSFDVPIEQLEMEPSDPEQDPGDGRILDLACGAGNWPK